MWIVGIILNIVVMTGLAPTATLPMAPELEMTTPAADLAPTVKAFFGTWEGTWDGGLAQPPGGRGHQCDLRPCRLCLGG